MIRIINDSDQEYINIVKNEPSELEYNYDKTPEELNRVIAKFQQYKFPSINDIKEKIKVPEDIEKTKIKITIKEIEKIFKESEKKLIENELDDIDNYISNLKAVYTEAEKTNENNLSDEKMALFIKWHKVVLSYETALCTILNSITSLHNQYVSKALSYFDTYLKEDTGENNEFKIAGKYDGFVSFESSELEKAIRNNDEYWLKAAILNTMWNDPTFTHGETDKLINILKKETPKLFEQEKKVPSEEKEPLDQSKWSKNYFTDLTYYFRENPALSRIPFIKKVGKYISGKGNNQKKKTITDNADFKDSMTYAGEDLKKAIDNKDYLWIKGTMMNSMWNDPTFEHGEFDKLLSICKKYVPQIFEQEKKVPSEEQEHLEQSKWTNDYFVGLTYWFKENPALSRIPYIKKVGKYVYNKK